MSTAMNLLVIIVVGVIIADLISHADGTKALFNNTANIWQTSVNGMLGQQTTSTPTSTPTGTLV